MKDAASSGRARRECMIEEQQGRCVCEVASGKTGGGTRKYLGFRDRSLAVAGDKAV